MAGELLVDEAISQRPVLVRRTLGSHHRGPIRASAAPTPVTDRVPWRRAGSALRSLRRGGVDTVGVAIHAAIKAVQQRGAAPAAAIAHVVSVATA